MMRQILSGHCELFIVCEMCGDRPFFVHARGRHQGAKRPFNFMANQVPDVKNKIRGLSPQISENMKRTPEFFPPIF